MIFLVVLLLSIGTAVSKCPPETTYIQQMNTCLLIVQNGTTYLQENGTFRALTDCRSRGGDLTSIHTSFENNLIFAYILQDSLEGNAYIGGFRENDQWTWTDGSFMNYTNWAGGEPKDGLDCVQMSRRNGKWITAKCNERNVSYFCSIPYSTFATIPPQL